MAVDLAYITDIASEFATVDSGRIDRLVAIAQLQTPAKVWGAKRDIGTAYLVCHMLKLDQLRGSGAVTAEAVKDLSRSYAAPASADVDGLDSTSYGREYKRMRKNLIRGVVVS